MIEDMSKGTFDTKSGLERGFIVKVRQKADGRRVREEF